MVETITKNIGVLPLITVITRGQAHRSGIHAQAELTFVSDLAGEGIDENHIHARKWATHGTDLDRLIRGVADLDGRLSLAEPVTDRHTPGTLDHIDQFRIQWLTGGHHLLRWVLQLGEIGLH